MTPKHMITAVNLTASPFLGGPERQMAGLASALGPQVRPVYLCLAEGGKSKPFVDELKRRGTQATVLKNNHPHLIRTIREVTAQLREIGADILLTHGYKASIIGLLAARLARIPIVMVSRGWTHATWKVRLYEVLDRVALRHADRVVCVSEGQAQKVRKARVPSQRITVIRNSIETSRFDVPNPEAGAALRSLFVDPMRHIVLAVGRLSPEKGFDVLADAARLACARRDDVGFAVIGDGPERASLTAKIRSLHLQRRFVLAGFRTDVDALLPHAACLAQSSHTEGMPNVVLEAMAAAIPVIATAVGGTPELVVDGKTGVLVPPRDPVALAEGLLQVLDDSVERAQMGAAGRDRVEMHFTFAAQAEGYEALFQKILARDERQSLDQALTKAAAAGAGT